MSIFTFLKAMLPRVQKATIEEDIRQTIGEMEQIVIPQYFSAGNSFKVNKLESADAKGYEKIFYKEVSMKAKGPNMVVDLHASLQRCYENLVYIQKVAEQTLEADLITDGLTAKKAHIVRAAAALSFISRFSIDFLNHLLILENNSRGDTKELAPAEIKHIENNVIRFFRGIEDYGMDAPKFQNVLSEIPDVVITSKNAASMNSMFSPIKLDPFNHQGMSGFTGNPIYHIRLVFAEWQTKRYNANKDKKKLLELRLLHLKSLQERKPNAKLEQEIEYIENRVSKLERAIREVEDSVPEQ